MCWTGDTVDLIESTTRRARLPHRCGECGRMIEPGESYLAERWIFDGDLGGIKICAQCNEARRWLGEVCEGWQYGAVLDELREHWDDDPVYRSLGLARLIAASRERWNRNGQLVDVDTVRAWVDDALRHVPEVAHG